MKMLRRKACAKLWPVKAVKAVRKVRDDLWDDINNEDWHLQLRFKALAAWFEHMVLLNGIKYQTISVDDNGEWKELSNYVFKTGQIWRKNKYPTDL